MADNKQSLEKSLARLEEIVHLLEDGKISLDESLELFEEGVKLVKLCGDRLDEAEHKVTILLKNGVGDYDEKPFGEDN